MNLQMGVSVPVRNPFCCPPRASTLQMWDVLIDLKSNVPQRELGVAGYITCTARPHYMILSRIMSTNTLIGQPTVTNYINTVVVCTIYTYDRCLTFPQEVNLVWRRRGMSVATGLYMLLHMSTTMILYSSVVSLIYKANYKLCHRTCLDGVRHGIVLHRQWWCVTLSSSITNLCQCCIVSKAFTTLRAYAISNRSVLLAFLIGSSFLVVAGACICAISTEMVIPVSGLPFACILGFNGEAFGRLTLVAQVFVILPETLLVTAIWCRVHWHVVMLAKDARIHAPLTTLFFRDGTIYFILILALVVSALVLGLTEVVGFVNFMPQINSTLQTILLSHFYLNLHEASANRGDTLSGASQQSDLRFARVVGTLAHSSVYDDQSILAQGDTDVEDASDADEEQREHRKVETEVSVISRSSAVDHESHPF
ncbi:uncharacterized protein B0H18DRAFT_32148 [Fomitopsis serialis]|uniref:uncharacterized protein n=1 Tax=Fomitopsis serialis TaxID=139415 RepID=UPI002008A93E|nr:uncharacterized protein B0H18DRAFT_32148 [Neoantrodia serialis]KAH9932617.1 hypothetical protein B0H18DRAFT_32148 [Neoantrodia serialis]